MPNIFWTGRLSSSARLVLNMSSIIAWITGNARDSSAMKERMKAGYNGEYSDYIHRYDDLASYHYEKISNTLIEKVDCNGKEVIDIGCGTGILSFIALEKGASRMSCVDMSKSMLEKCRGKSITKGYTESMISFHESDAEKLPFDDSSYDIVLSNMVLGMIPNQQAVITELTRILRPGGILALSAHGPAHYLEAIEACVKSMNVRYFLGHRMEFWPRSETEIKTLLMSTGLDNIQTMRLTWIDKFDTGSEVFDFFAATSGLWWYHRLPPEIRNKETEKTRAYFQRRNIAEITSDVVFAFGSKKKGSG